MKVADYCVATTWDDDLLAGLARLNDTHAQHGSRVYEVFASFPLSVTGSGRAPTAVPFVTLAQAGKHIERAHSYGIRFNYLFNGSCTGNVEFTLEGHDRFLRAVSTLVEMGVDTITLTNPYLIEVVRGRFPSLEINASILCYIDSPFKAHFFEGIGANRITVDQVINREFGLLRGIRETIRCDIEIYANVNCLLQCPTRVYHFNLTSHSSQDAQDDCGSFFIEYPVLKCTTTVLEHPEEFIKSPWIRPEDVQYYLDTGIRFFKIAGRTKSTERLLCITEAYMARNYDGNLYDLVGKSWDYFDRQYPSLAPGPVAPPKMFIPNKALDGFLDFFENKSVSCHSNCHACQYCKMVAERLIVADREESDRFIQHNRQTLATLADLDYTGEPYAQARARWRANLEGKRSVT